MQWSLNELHFEASPVAEVFIIQHKIHNSSVAIYSENIHIKVYTNIIINILEIMCF
jgi:hypothetical protein